MARYEYSDGKSHEFWEIERSGSTFTVRYGKVGTAGQTNTKVFDSPEQAEREAEKMVRSKVKKGYAEVAAVARAEPGRNPDLEAAILDRPDDADAWRVYADWLMGEGDPRGDLVAAYVDGRDPTALHEAHEAEFLGRFAGDLASFVQITWANGFWQSVTIGSVDYDDELPESVAGLGRLVGHVLRHPSARFLFELRLGLPAGEEAFEPDWQESIDAVVKNGVRPSVRHLVVGDFEYPDETEISWAQIGTLAKVWAVLPRLEHLEVQGAGIQLGAVVAPELRKLELRTGGLSKEPVHRLAAASLPELRDLEIWFGTEMYEGECGADEVRVLLAACEGWPALRRLGLMNADFADAIPALVAEAAVLAQLDTLDLSMGTMTDEGARVLIEQADRFRHLDRLSVDENAISDEVVSRLTEALPNAHIGTQDVEYGTYVSVGE